VTPNSFRIAVRAAGPAILGLRSPVKVEEVAQWGGFLGQTLQSVVDGCAARGRRRRPPWRGWRCRSLGTSTLAAEKAKCRTFRKPAGSTCCRNRRRNSSGAQRFSRAQLPSSLEFLRTRAAVSVLDDGRICPVPPAVGPAKTTAANWGAACVQALTAFSLAAPATVARGKLQA
jgi:hypothetical protein